MIEEKPEEESGLSPLDQIRLCEAEVTRRIAAARQAGEQNVAKARSEASNLKNEAKERGLRKGQAQYQAILSGAEEEAEAIVAKAQKRAEAMLQRGESGMEKAVAEAVKIIIGPVEGEGTR
jgi:vacuolar-type H+-ATPase subunit H